MSDILFLCQRLPYPPDKGEKIRAFHLLRHLAERHRVFLGCFVDDSRDWQYVDELTSLCTTSYFQGLNPTWATICSATGFLTRRPLSTTYYENRRLKRWVAQIVNEYKPKVAVIYSSVMAQYLTGHLSQFANVVIDFVDVDSDKWRQYAKRKQWPMSWIYHREARRLLAYDRRWAQAVSAATFVSQPEAELFRHHAPEVADKIHVIANGVDSSYFAPDIVAPMEDGSPYPRVVLTGTMNYWPNEDAAIWFAKDIWPKIRRHYANAQFIIVGARPSRSVQALGNADDIEVTGRVDDIRPYLAAADVVVAPMRIARGVQNKILEGMAVGKPVVTTPQGLEGIDARSGEHLVVAEGADLFAEAILQCLQPPMAQRLGQAGRQLILENYDWPSKLAAFDALLDIKT